MEGSILYLFIIKLNVRQWWIRTLDGRLLFWDPTWLQYTKNYLPVREAGIMSFSAPWGHDTVNVIMNIHPSLRTYVIPGWDRIEVQRRLVQVVLVICTPLLCTEVLYILQYPTILRIIENFLGHFTQWRPCLFEKNRYASKDYCGRELVLPNSACACPLQSSADNQL